MQQNKIIVHGIHYVFTTHAVTVMTERNIPVEWIEQVLKSPNQTEDDRHDGELKHFLRVIKENDNRILRVVTNDHSQPKRIVTLFFDRKQRKKL